MTDHLLHTRELDANLNGFTSADIAKCSFSPLLIAANKAISSSRKSSSLGQYFSVNAAISSGSHSLTIATSCRAHLEVTWLPLIVTIYESQGSDYI